MNPEGILATFALPLMNQLKKSQRLLALDAIQDPGNMGTLLRTCLALGWDGCFLLPGCTDPFSDKALRAAKGATFFLPLVTGSWDDLFTFSKANRLRLLLADVAGKSVASFSLDEPLCLVMGNESKGISENVKDLFEHISIPMSGAMQSLNVSSAAAILLHLLRGKYDTRR